MTEVERPPRPFCHACEGAGQWLRRSGIPVWPGRIRDEQIEKSELMTCPLCHGSGEWRHA